MYKHSPDTNILKPVSSFNCAFHFPTCTAFMSQLHHYFKKVSPSPRLLHNTLWSSLNQYFMLSLSQNALSTLHEGACDKQDLHLPQKASSCDFRCRCGWCAALEKHGLLQTKSITAFISRFDDADFLYTS